MKTIEAAVSLALIRSQLLVFSVTPFKLDFKKKIKTIQYIKSRIWEKKEGEYEDSPQKPGHNIFFFLWKICGETFSPKL